jgi:hypothetical protein
MSFKRLFVALALSLICLYLTDIGNQNSSLIHDATMLLIASAKIDNDKRK